MRRAPALVMCTLTAGVLGVSLRTSQLHHALAAPAPVGLVTPTAAPTASPAPARVAVPTPTPTQTPAKVRVRVRATPTHRATAGPTPRPVVTTPAATSVTVNGQSVDTYYGPVQVQITVRGGQVVRADAIDYPQGSGRDQEINSYAIPQLDQETLQAQSAQIDTVSGASYTSDGYRQSLQSALDAAHQAGAL